MKISDALDTAATQFLKNYGAGGLMNKALEQYATNELKFDRGKAIAFARNASNGLLTEQLNTNEKKERFFLWYYLNYVTGQKNGRQSTELTVEIAFLHFQDYVSEQNSRNVFEKFAKEELNLTDLEASAFSGKELDHSKFNRFYTWYYLNYIVNRKWPK